MDRSHPQRSSRGGFTLPELLVGVAMVGVLSAVVLPTVVGQIAKGETQRVVQDLQAVEQAAQMFRNDVGKWPGDLEDLVVLPTGGDAPLEDTGSYPSNIATLWQGPYLARGDVGSGLPTSGGTIDLDIQNLDWDGLAGSADFVAFTVTFSGSSADTRADNVDLAVDGSSGESLTDATHGKIRYSNPTLYYFTSPAK